MAFAGNVDELALLQAVRLKEQVSATVLAEHLGVSAASAQAAYDALYARQVLGLRPAPEFEDWMRRLGMVDDAGRVLPVDAAASPLRALTVAR